MFAVFLSFAWLWAMYLWPAYAANRLPFNSDGWALLAIAHQYGQWWTGLIRGIEAGWVMYPATNVFAYNEAMPAAAHLLLMLEAVTGSTMAGLFLFLGLMPTIASTGMYLLAVELGAGFWGAFFAGFAFSFNNLYLAQIDNTVWVTYPLLPLMLLQLERYRRDSGRRHLLVGAAVGAAQVYFSAYVFVLHGLVGALYFVVLGWHRRTGWREVARAGLKFFAVFVAVALPMILVYLRHKWVVAPVDPMDDLMVARHTSLRPLDFFRVLPGNVLYPSLPFDVEFVVQWALQRRRAFVGVLLPLLALVGFWRRRDFTAWFLLALAVAGTLIALGPVWHAGDMAMNSPLHWFYDHVPLFKFFRVPVRAYFIAVFAACLLAGSGLGVLIRGLQLPGRWQIVVPLLLVGLHALENVPFPVPSYDVGRFLHAPRGYLEVLAKAPEAVVVNLPAGMGWKMERADEDVHPYEREWIYMNYQAQHHRHSVNGVSSYLPQSRLDAEPHLRRFPAPEAVRHFRGVGVTHIAFHKALAMAGETWQESALRESGDLRLIFEDDDVLIFVWRESD